MKKGKLYGIGVGPGDPELLTLKAKKILDEADVIAVPVKEKGEESTALEIIRPVVELEGKELLEVIFRMAKDKEERLRCREAAGRQLTEVLDAGKDIAMITLGDVAVYSTYMYVNQYAAERGYETEIIPGIPSFCSGAAAAQLPLMEGNESLVIVPSVKAGKALEEAIANFDNVVVMKAGGSIGRIGELLEKYGRGQDCATVLSCVGMKEEYIGPLDPEREYSYFTTVMIKREKR